jgi:hypothetical protein
MKTVFTNIFFLSATLISLAAQGQPPKNFPEVFAGVEWNTISGLTGISYERYIFQKDKWVLGAKATYAFNYKLSNLELLSRSNEGTVSFSSITATGHKFFSHNSKGFFICSELGIGSRSHDYYEAKSSTTFTAFEAGLGWQFRVGDKLAIRWTNTLTFAGQGGITITRLSVGF